MYLNISFRSHIMNKVWKIVSPVFSVICGQNAFIDSL